MLILSIVTIFSPQLVYWGPANFTPFLPLLKSWRSFASPVLFHSHAPAANECKSSQQSFANYGTNLMDYIKVLDGTFLLWTFTLVVSNPVHSVFPLVSSYISNFPAVLVKFSKLVAGRLLFTLLLLSEHPLKRSCQWLSFCSLITTVALHQLPPGLCWQWKGDLFVTASTFYTALNLQS